MKTFSVKIGSEGKASGLYSHIADSMKDNGNKPLDVLINLLNGGNGGSENQGISLSDLDLDDLTKLDKYGGKTEHELVTEMFLDTDGNFNLNMLKKCIVAMAKADYSRAESGTQWHNKEDKQVKIHEVVTAQMTKNHSTPDERWFERVLINSKWISINCNTSMFNADEYLLEHQKEVDEHNQKTRTVDGKDLGRYFNRSARAAQRKAHKAVPEAPKAPEAPEAPEEIPEADSEEILGADGQPL